MGLGGSLHAVRSGSRILFETAAGRPVLTYGELSAVDSAGRHLPATISLSGRTLRILVDARGARYPVRIDPFLQQGGKLTGSEESGAGLFGSRVAISADGSTAIVGGPSDNGHAGAAWIFTRSQNTWTQQGPKLTGSGETGEGQFGSSVAISASGTTVLVGGYEDSAGSGAAWVFHRSGATWTQQPGKLTGSGESGAGHFGYSAALSEDGSTAVIGGGADNSGAGAVWAFHYNGSSWAQQGAKLTGAGESGQGHLGVSVAVSASGDAIFAGAPADNGNLGAAWAFVRSGESWAQQGGKLTGTKESGLGEFGVSVALSGSAESALVGGSGDGKLAGAVWTFARSGSTWSQQGNKLIASGEVGEGHFGFSVALTADGKAAVMGAGNDNGGVGAVWTYTRSGSSWTLQGPKLTGGGEVGAGHFGYSVALSADGTHALVGGVGDNGSVGAAWVFAPPSAPSVLTGVASGVGQVSAVLGGSVDPNGQLVSDCRFEYGPTVAYGQSVPCASAPGSGSEAVGVSGEVVGLSANSVYHFRVSATNATGASVGADGTFTTLPEAPSVLTGSASGVSSVAATLGGSVNPNSGAVVDCRFEYGTTVAYGRSVPCSSLPGSGSEAVEVSAEVAGLNASSVYHFRVSARNAGGTSVGSDGTFETAASAPSVLTGVASGVGQVSAVLGGSVDPNGQLVSDCRFEYGPTVAYGQSVPCASAPGSGSEAVGVSGEVVGLSANSVYHFRVSATNATGTSVGADGTFTTLPEAPSVLTGSASGVSSVAATLGGSVNPNSGAVVDCRFEYGTTVAYGRSVPCSSLPGSGSEAVEVSAEVAGLNASSVYHFRVSARNAGGTSVGSDGTFETAASAPSVLTGVASGVGQVSAVLGGSVDPNGQLVSDCRFEYGPTVAYGQSVPCASRLVLVRKLWGCPGKLWVCRRTAFITSG